MNVVHTLPSPLNTFVVDIPAQTYYDFQLPAGSRYPLKGVTYPVNYGHILGHTSEDGHELDLFVGTTLDGLNGYFIVNRGDNIPNEHKFYVALTENELSNILVALAPVLISNHAVASQSQLLQFIAKYKDLHGND